MDQGMNVARLNFSHGTQESHAKFVEVIREVNKAHPSRKLAIMLDTKGP
jgi:pyruvate kinase